MFILAGAGFDVAFGCDDNGLKIPKIFRQSSLEITSDSERESALISGVTIPCLPDDEKFRRNIMHPMYLLSCLENGFYGWEINVKVFLIFYNLSYFFYNLSYFF